MFNEIVSRQLPSARRESSLTEHHSLHTESIPSHRVRTTGTEQDQPRNFQASERPPNKYHVSHIIFYRSTFYDLRTPLSDQNVYNFLFIKQCSLVETSSMRNLFLEFHSRGSLQMVRKIKNEKEIQRVFDCWKETGLTSSVGWQTMCRSYLHGHASKRKGEPFEDLSFKPSSTFRLF